MNTEERLEALAQLTHTALAALADHLDRVGSVSTRLRLLNVCDQIAHEFERYEVADEPDRK